MTGQRPKTQVTTKSTKRGSTMIRGWLALIIIAVVAFGAGYFFWRPSTKLPDSTGIYAIGKFLPTIPNPGAAPSQTPEGMIWVPGGEFSMGAQDPPAMDEVGMQATKDSRPIHRVYVDAFWMDSTDVTNQQFAQFVRATKYITVAERKPKAEDFPGAPPENLVPGAVVFSPPDHPVLLNNYYQWWSYVPGA